MASITVIFVDEEKGFRFTCKREVSDGDKMSISHPSTLHLEIGLDDIDYQSWKNGIR